MSGYNSPPPRRGFTQALTGRERNPAPVVVGIGDSAASILALRRAADEAAHRSTRLHVIAGGPAEDTLETAIEDEREWHVISSILRNPHVTVSTVDETSPEALLEYCREVHASLLVIGCDDGARPGSLENPETAHQLVDEAGCDVLVIHAEEQVGHA